MSLSLETSTSSLWLESTARVEYPRLDRDLGADVAILGGGMAGVTAALLLSRADVSSCVLEAGRIGAGVTGHSTAKVTSLHGLTYADLCSKFGDELARSYGEANQAGLEQIASFVEELGIDCDFERRPNYTYTESSGERAQIEAEVEAAAKLGLPAEYTEQTDLPFRVAAAMRFDNQAQFHPSKYLNGIAAAAAQEGAQLFEGTRAVAVKDAKPCQVRTDTGHTVWAKQVIVATNFPILDRGLYFARLHAEREYVIAVRLRQTPPQGMYLSADQPSHSIRSHPVGRQRLLVLAGESHKSGQTDAAERYRRLEAFAHKRFDVEGVEHRWSTQDAMPVDGLPYIGRLTSRSDRIYTATGFKKWGLAKGTAAAMILRDLITGEGNEWARVFDPGRINVRASASELLKHNANVAVRFLGDRITKHPSVDRLRAGEGAIIRKGLRQVAAYRDETGDLHEVSARCTHLGCILAFNDAERTWDCPCHGSRFTVEGEVLQGPAVRKLARAGDGSAGSSETGVAS